MAPAVVRRDAFDAERADPFGEALGHLLVVRIRIFAPAAAGRVVEQRPPAARLRVDEQSLLDQVGVQRHLAVRARLVVGAADPDHPDAVALDEVGRRQRREFIDAGTGVGADPGQPAARRRHLLTDQVRKLLQRGREDRPRLFAVEALFALLDLLPDADLDVLRRIFGELPLVDGELQQRLDGGEIDVADRDVRHAAAQQRVLPGDDVGARRRGRVVVAEMADKPLDDRGPALDGRGR